MAKYRATGTVTGGKYLGEFEAPSAAEAERMAWESDEASVSVCHQCGAEVEDPEVTEINVEEVEERILEWIALPHGGGPGAACPFPGGRSVWFRIIQDGRPGTWIESEHVTGAVFLRDLKDWWGGGVRELDREPPTEEVGE